MKILKTTLLAAAIFATQAQAEVSPFDITLSFSGGLSDTQQEIFYEAESFWESVIIGYDGSVSFPTGLRIAASGEDIDGVGKILGSAGPSGGYQNRTIDNNLFYATSGSMRFDTADLDSLETKGSLLSVIIHEMAHVIGFGTLWGPEYNNLYTDGTGQYTGAYAVAAYQEEFAPLASFIPVELDGGEGTEDAHWDENWGGPQSDLMTGFFEGSITYSKTTLASFRDLGYLVLNESSNVEENPSDVPIAFIGLFSAIGLLSTRRKKF